jgi:hypothetical protein
MVVDNLVKPVLPSIPVALVPPAFDTIQQNSKWMCQELKEAISRGEVKFGDTGRIVNCSAGMDVPLMTGRGGLKVFVRCTS